LARVRRHTDVPLVVGFGISTAEHVRQVGEIADGAIVASALIDRMEQAPDADVVATATSYLREVQGAEPAVSG
ncbi:tryptophan synthase subunit alpha, partial [Kouleothrix aurantiaca]